MLLRPSALLVIAISSSFVLSPSLAQGQSGKQANNFDLILNGKGFGKDAYTLTKEKSGYKVVSHLAGVTKGLQIDVRDTLNYADDYAYLEATESNQDSNLQMAWIPSKDHRDMTLNSSGGGNVSSSVEPLAGSSPLLNLPAFDAGAIQAAILYVTSRSSDSGYTVWLPGYTLSGIGARAGVGQDDNSAIIQTETLPPGPHSFNAQWIKGPSFTGTLDGKSLKINSFQLGFGKYRWTFFTDESNTLMQANVSVLHASYIRSRFKLDAPAQSGPSQ